MANLSDLPEELVCNIAMRLWSDDVQSLRLTCKALEEKTLHDFALEYFSDKAVIISSSSLKTLNAIANSDKLRGFLRRVHVLTAYFSDSAFTCGKACPYGNCCGWQPTIRQREAWKFLVQDAKDLKASGRDKDMLTQAFSKLPTLSEIVVVDTSGAIPANVDICQMRKVARLCGRNFQLPCDSKSDPEYHRTLSHTWSIVTTAIANSGTSTLKRFSTSLGKGNNALCIPLDIRFNDAKFALLKKALKNVESFALQTTTRLRRNASGAEKQSILKASLHRVQRLAYALPSLQSLSLDFEGQSTDNVIFSNLATSLDLSMLKKLQLHTLVTNRQVLMAAFARLNSVQDLYLSFVDLSKGSWIPVLKQLQGIGDHLEHLHLMYLLENGKKAYFLSQPEDDGLNEDGMLLDDFLGMGPEADLSEPENDDEMDDDDLPPLETMDGEVIGGASTVPPSTTTPIAATVEDSDDEVPQLVAKSITPPGSPHLALNAKPAVPEMPKPGSPDYHASIDHKAPGNESYPERGYYVCIRGKEEIQKQLKTFVQEYNVGEEVGVHGPPGAMGGMVGGAMAIPVPVTGPPGQAPNMNNILNGLAGYLGLPPMPGQNGAGGAGAGGAGGGLGGATGGANAGAQQGGANGNNAANGMHPATTAANGAGPTSLTPAGPPPAGNANLFTPQNFADFMVGGGPAPGAAATDGATMDEWDTEPDSSEFESGSEL